MGKYITNEIVICLAIIIHNIKTINALAEPYVNLIKGRTFSNVQGKIVENQNILMFLKHGSLDWNCLNTSCVRKDKGDFIATTICEVLDSFNKIVNKTYIHRR